MGKPDAYTFKDFTGLDLRTGVETTPPDAAIVAVNVVLSTGGDYIARPPLRKVANLHPDSHGLYVAGDTLRTAMAWTNISLPFGLPGVLTYDILRGGLIGATGVSLSAVEDMTAWQGRPYLSVRFNDSGELRYEHHFVQAPASPIPVTLTSGSNLVPELPAPRGDPYLVRFAGVGTGYTSWYRVLAAGVLETPWPGASAAAVAAIMVDPADTKVSTPFEPGAPVTTAAEKVWAVERTSNNVWFSSTEFGPTVWDAVTAPDDAGFLPTSTHIDGDQPILGLGTYRGQLLVLARRALQVWNIDPDPAKHSLAGNVGGSGCDFPRTVANVGGDIVLFATGQFRTLSAIITTGQPKDTDIGAKIARQTRAYRAGDATQAVGAWWPEMQLYLGVVGDQGYAFTNSPASGAQGWTNWRLPFSVSHMAAWNGKLYVRRSDTPELWVFEPDSQDYTDENEVRQFEWTVQLAWNTLDQTRRMKLLRQLVLPQEGTAGLRLWYSPRDPSSFDDWFELDGTTTGLGRVMLGAMTEIVSPQLTGKGYWRVGEITIYYERGNLQ